MDIRTWRKRGYLARAGAFGWYWHIDGERTGEITVYVHDADSLTLGYALTVDGQPRDASQLVRLGRTACPYGNSRPWFLCPGCNRRSGVLYLRRGRFACRLCQKVAYASQSEDVLDRLWRKQAKIEARLGDHWQRPKGMRRNTHAKLRNALIDLEQRREKGLEMILARKMALG